MPVLKLRASEAVIGVVLRLFAAIELIAPDYKPGDLQFEMLPDSGDRATGTGARTCYWANLPTLPDGNFDMDAVSATVKENLRSLGAHTLNGIVYQDIVDATLKGERATEPAIRNARMMKPGSSQGAVQKLFAMRLIDRGPVEAKQGNAS